MSATPYTALISSEIARQGCIGRYDPRHIEAYMRLEHSTLDALSLTQFASEVAIARECIDANGAANAETLARSFGL